MKTNIIYCGDCKKVLMDRIPDNSIDLIYLDPPFFSNKKYENIWHSDQITTLSFSDKDWDKLKSEIDPAILKQYEHIRERWKAGHKGMNVYIAYMRERINQCHRVLKKTGSIYLHCDWHASHYLKMMMDEVFGYENFRNEVVWCYKSGGASKTNFSKKHDIILFYSKTKKWYFNFQKEKSYGQTGGGQGGKVKYFKDENGTYSWAGMKDWWLISMLSTTHSERLGYPTQKPEALLQRIIKASSNEGDIILDPFCGCGTTLAVAYKLKRKFIGIDIAPKSARVIKDRLSKIQAGVTLNGAETMDDLKEMHFHEFQKLMVHKLGGKSGGRGGDKGIDGWIEFQTVPVQVKHWKNKVARQEIDRFKTAVERVRAKKGVMIAFEFTKPCYEECARMKKEYGIDIQLRMVKDIIKF